MPDPLIINDKIGSFEKVISVSGDKCISIRWVLISSIANGVSTAKNLLMSEDVLAAIQAIKILGVKRLLKIAKFLRLNSFACCFKPFINLYGSLTFVSLS